MQQFKRQFMKIFFCAVFSMGVLMAMAQNSISVTNTFSQYVQNTNKDYTGTSKSMISFATKQETEGSPYLFNDWAKGTVFLKNNEVLAEADYVLNFDKTRNLLLLKSSGQNVIEVDMDAIAGFQLQNASGTYSLLAIPQIGKGYFVELYKGSAFSLYKTLNTKFFKSDYVNKGLYETGYKYDRYVDENKYYISAKEGTVYPVGNTKKELKKLVEALPAAKKFLEKSEISTTDTEADLISLTTFLNQQ